MNFFQHKTRELIGRWFLTLFWCILLLIFSPLILIGWGIKKLYNLCYNAIVRFIENQRRY
jgi:hypothetical protein